MTKKILALMPPADNDAQAWAAYLNTMARYIQIKEEQAHKAKTELLVLWTDYFKPQHLEQFPDLHDVFWGDMPIGRVYEPHHHHSQCPSAQSQKC